MGSQRILTVCGSLGEASANRSLLDVVERVLSQLGVEATTDAQLGALPALRPELVDAPGTAVTTFRRQIAIADAVIIAAPEYAGSLAGAVKNALDWVVGSGDLYGKPVGILSAGTTGGPFARQVLARTLVWQGADLVAQLGVATPRTKSDAAGTLTDEHTIAALEAFTNAVVRSTRATADERAAISEAVAGSLGVHRHLAIDSIAVFAGFD